MKVIEIDCMVNPGIINDKRIENYTLARPSATDKERIKAKLVIEYSERKLNLKRSDIVKAVSQRAQTYVTDDAIAGICEQLGFSEDGY